MTVKDKSRHAVTCTGDHTRHTSVVYTRALCQGTVFIEHNNCPRTDLISVVHLDSYVELLGHIRTKQD